MYTKRPRVATEEAPSGNPKKPWREPKKPRAATDGDGLGPATEAGYAHAPMQAEPAS